ncbi:MAG: hypothetical protein V3U80_06010 [Flavobacteriaceae bacterium]
MFSEDKKENEIDFTNGKINPNELVDNASKIGIKSILKMLPMVFIFALVNTIIYIYSLFGGFEDNVLRNTSLVFLIGLLFTFIAGYKTYRYVMVTIFSSVYHLFTPFIRKVSNAVVAKGDSLLQGKKTKNSKVIDVGKLLTNSYNKVPGFLKFGMTFLINRIPFVEMLMDLKSNMDENESDQVKSDQLYYKINDYVKTDVFDSNTTKWVYWLLPLNIAVLVLFIYFK